MHTPPPPYAATGSPEEKRHRLASWSQRLLARLIDWVLLVVPVGICSMLIGGIIAGGRLLIGNDMEMAQFSIIVGIVFFIAFTAYDTVCVRKWRRTFGKQMMGLEVAPLAAVGWQGPIPVLSILARAALVNLWVLFSGVHIVAITFPVYVLALVFLVLWPLWDAPNRQGMQDKLAGTVVVRGD